MFYGHIYTIVIVHSIKECDFSRSTVTSFLRNILDDAKVAVMSGVINLRKSIGKLRL